MVHFWWALAGILELSFSSVVGVLGAALSADIDKLLGGLVIALLLVNARWPSCLPRYPPSSHIWPRGQRQACGIALLDWRDGLPRIIELKQPSTDLRPLFDFVTPSVKWVPV